ncbi:class I SAM-dependent methyltransferase [Dyadobacter sandarakinus]|uniref:Class I SAM-dependent methyltransferase n=1 Tax=Dyadobacter sandarakinus TaxID=2747268 RepID=A0ABX7I919_9BACT|nr:class I SAM-dependent methyltransferase [Dyadobacter sandarakinus]QRR02612.1 class I SAM-dependent methyltransferase [Dyadobacter sandarakinus]
MQLSNNIKDSYSNQYDESSVKWRNTGARYKALNIVELSKSIQFKSVLEVGAGEGSILKWLSEWDFSKNLNCIEISESGIELIKSKKIQNLNDILLFNGYQIPYPDDHFDLVICSHVLEHVEHERILLREIKRVSKYQIFEVPIDFSFYVDRKLDHFLSYGHINIYTPSLFRFLLKSENFEIMNDINYFYNDEVLQLMHKKKNTSYYIMKLKFAIIKTIPFLKGVKPSSYAVLTHKTGKNLSILK